MTDAIVPKELPNELPKDLVDHLCRSSALTAQEAKHLINEILAFYATTPETFLRQRHQELQSYGRSNSDIFTALQQELQDRRFSCKPMTTRQIRRAIYG